MYEHIQYLAFLQSIGPVEWLVIAIVLLLLFGRKLPELARNIGKSLTEFKKGINEAKDTQDDVINDVNKIKDDVTKQAKDASGMDELNKS